MYLEFDPDKPYMKRIDKSRYLIETTGSIYSTDRPPPYHLYNAQYVQRMGNTSFVLSNKNQLFNCGRIRELRTYDQKGYRKIKLRLTKGGKHEKYRLARITAAAFLPESRDLKTLQVHHKDGNTANDNVNNLQWVTPKEHAAIHAQMRKKEKKDEE